MRYLALAPFLAAVATLAAISPANARQGEEPASPLLLVKASITTAGPYGESWYLTLAPDGEANLQVSYRTNPSGTLLARFSLSEEYVLAVRETVASEEFFALPPELAPSQSLFHQPRLVLDVYLGGGHHTVSLYDPDALKDQPSSNRFLAVWRRVFEALPYRPSW